MQQTSITVTDNAGQSDSDNATISVYGLFNPSADLAVNADGIKLNESDVVEGETVQVSVKAYNLGGADASNFGTKVNVSSGFSEEKGFSIAANSSNTTTFGWTPSSAGT